MDTKSRSGSRMNNPDHPSDILKTIFSVKKLKFFDADPGWEKFKSTVLHCQIQVLYLGALSKVLNFFFISS
jgi:hypothetical protein